MLTDAYTFMMYHLINVRHLPGDCASGCRIGRPYGAAIAWHARVECGDTRWASIGRREGRGIRR